MATDAWTASLECRRSGWPDLRYGHVSRSRGRRANVACWHCGRSMTSEDDVPERGTVGLAPEPQDSRLRRLAASITTNGCGANIEGISFSAYEADSPLVVVRLRERWQRGFRLRARRSDSSETSSLD